ncbi:MAG: TAXI family TRAP transporter solute-binding subunit [Peptostreptococcaceae bacterium]|nr:TAXI family TRAP transporter solute-binding subunit [Peptostreptococcaceae bacterium]
MNKKMIALFAALLLVGCGTQSSEIQKGSGERAERSVIINIPTASTTGTLYPLGSSIAAMWNEKIPYVRANAQASNGGIENLNLLRSGEAQVSMAVISNIYQSANGTAKFEGRANEDLRIIAGLYYNPNQIVVRDGAGIQEFMDLAGRKFASGSPGSTTEDEAKVHFLSAGIAYPDGIKAQFIGFTEAIDLMRNKQIDGAWIMAGLPTSAVTEMTTTANGRLIGLSEEQIAKLRREYPWYAEYTIPANTYKGQEQEIKTTAIKMAMFTSADIPEDVVYDLTKAFWENLETLKASNASLQGISIEQAVTDLADLPLHEGAIRYYKEVGVLE